MEYMRRPELQRTAIQAKTALEPLQRQGVPSKTPAIRSIPKPIESAEHQAIRAFETTQITPVPDKSLELQRLAQHRSQQKTALQRVQALQKSTTKNNRTIQSEISSIRDAIQLRQDYNLARASSQTQQQANNFEQTLRRPEVPMQRGKNPTLAGISEHFIAETSTMKAAKDEQYNVIQRLKTAGKTLVAEARVQRFPMPELAAAIQRFTDPLENTAVRSSAFSALGMNPSMTVELQRALAENEANLELQRKNAQKDQSLEEETPTGLSDRISAQLSGGQPLPKSIQQQLELHFNTDLSTVRIHTDPTAHELSQKVNAVAFTTGQHIFFTEGTYDPDSSSGFELLAHEVTHTIQQGAGQVSAGIDSDPSLESAAQEQGRKAVSNKSNLEQQVKQPASNNFEKFMGFPAPLRSSQDEQTMKEARTSTVENLTTRGVHSKGWQALTEAVHGEQPAFPREANLKPHLEKDGTAQNKQSEGITNANLQTPTARVQRKANQNKETSFTLQREALPIQRFSIKGAVSEFLGVIPGYKQICAVFGKDLVTGTAIQQNPNAILDALSDLVPGPIKNMVKALRESNAIPKAWAWFKAELSKINIGAAWQGIKDGLGSFSLLSMNVGEVKDKIKAAVMKPISQVKSLIVGSIRKLAEIALEAISAMFPGAGKQVIDGLKSAGDVIIEVIKNPGKFIKNLVQALKGGVSNFAANAKKHFTSGLGQWLSGESGLAFPNNLDVKGVFTLALTVLGVTYANFRKSLVTKLGEEKTKFAETKIDFVQNIMSKGMMAAEGMEGHQSSVKTEVVDGAKDFVKTSVVQAAVMKLASMFIPGGGLITAFMTGFDMIKFVINEGSRIASLVSSIVGSVSSIARGDIGGAVAKVESSLAKTIPLALSFLSRIFKVSGIGTKIKEIIKRIKGKIDGVVKKVMDKAATVVAKMATTVGNGVQAGTNAVKKLINGVFGKKSFTAGKEQHSVWVKVTNNQPELWIASTPREATAQINALEAEAKTKNILPLVANSLKLARDKVSSAKANLKKKVAAGVVDDTAMSRHATEAVNGVEFSVKDVFEQIEKGISSTNLKLNLNFGQLKQEFWASGRPTWSAATKKALGTISDTEDRRHIQAFDDIFKNAVAAINGKSFKEAASLLATKGFKPSSLELQEIKNKLKSYLVKEFNRIENLWVGEKAENQQKGSQFGAAERELKGLKEGTPEYEAALTRRSAAVVDPDKGIAGGKKVSTREQGWINQINSVENRLPDYSKTFSKGQLKPGLPDFDDARDDRNATEANQRRLGDFSKQMDSSEYNKVNTALTIAAKVVYELNRMLKR